MRKENKVYLASAIVWVVNVKIFLLLANYIQVYEIFSLSHGLTSFVKNLLIFYYDFFLTLSWTIIFLSTVFAITLLYFWISYFKVYFYKLPKVENTKSGLVGILSSIISFIGFGCVACGQTLITSVLFLFVGSTSAFLAHSIGNISIVVGTILLVFGVRRNMRMFKDKNICRI
jgi:hypothetical protein